MDNEIIKDWRAVLVEGRNALVIKIADMNWTYSHRKEKMAELNRQIETIDKILAVHGSTHL